MARTKRSRRSYGAGEWGRNRVRVFPDPKTGRYQIEWRENGRRLTRSLKHRDWSRAKRQADEAAAGLAGLALNGRKDAEPEPLTLGTLFEIYGEEVTPTKGERSQKYDRGALQMFLRFFGTDRRPATLSQRDWDRFIRERRAGRIGPRARPVSDRTVERDLRFLLAVLNWAARSRDEAGGLLLDSNPLKGLRVPREKNPTRVDSLSGGVTRPCSGCPVRSIGAFAWRSCSHTRQGTGSAQSANSGGPTWTWEPESIRWRAEHEKTGFEHRTPVTDEALSVLGRGAEGEPPKRRRPSVARAQGPREQRGPPAGAATGGRGPKRSPDWSASVAGAGIR